MADRRPSGSQRLPVTLAAGAVLVGGLVAAIVAVDRANGSPSQSTATSPTPRASATASPSASPSPAPIPFADCAAQKFGAPLAPLNPPANVHVYSAPPPMTIDTTKLYLATITTARGVITICLQPDLAPVTVNNFVTLARNHFYDGLKFHRVVAGFVIQGGDPLGTGSGGPGYKFNDEPVRQQYTAGAVAMANSGANTNGSQFFICTVDDTTKLQPLYNLFGNVVTGLTVAQQIQQGDVMTSVTVAQQS